MSDYFNSQDHIDRLTRKIEADLHTLHGVLLTGSSLKSSLGYSTLAAMRNAIARNNVPVPTFKIDKRKGHFALSCDVARYLAQRRLNAKHDDT